MTTALFALAFAAFIAFLMYRAAKRPPTSLNETASARQALLGPSGVIEKGDPTPTREAATLSKPLAERTAADYYDPLTEQVDMTFNEYGFITSPSPLPVWNGKTVKTDGDVFEMLNDLTAVPAPERKP